MYPALVAKSIVTDPEWCVCGHHRSEDKKPCPVCADRAWKADQAVWMNSVDRGNWGALADGVFRLSWTKRHHVSRAVLDAAFMRNNSCRGQT